MKRTLQLSIVNAIYFSVASFMVVWLAGFLYEYLQKTSGRIDLGLVIVLVLCVILIMFFFALTNVFLSENAQRRTSLFERLLAVVAFFLVASLILAGLGVLFWIPL